MSFHDVRFPVNLSLGSVGGPERRTEIVTLSNGFEERNTPWAHSRRRYDAGAGMRSLDDIAVLVAFFEARRGMLHGFRWKDWADYKSCVPSGTPVFLGPAHWHGRWRDDHVFADQALRGGKRPYLRPISKPVAGTALAGVAGDELIAGVHFEVDGTTGSLTFFDPPEPGAEVTAGFEFDVPVRFDTDAIRTSVGSFQAGEVPDVPVVELRQ
jgi:uncharacterized protein (TIGR02217 family)